MKAGVKLCEPKCPAPSMHNGWEVYVLRGVDRSREAGPCSREDHARRVPGRSQQLEQAKTHVPA